MESNISGGKHGHGRFDTVVAVEEKVPSRFRHFATPSFHSILFDQPTTNLRLKPELESLAHPPR